jgi:hypothetical protein
MALELDSEYGLMKSTFYEFIKYVEDLVSDVPFYQKSDVEKTQAVFFKSLLWGIDPRHYQACLIHYTTGTTRKAIRAPSLREMSNRRKRRPLVLEVA